MLNENEKWDVLHREEMLDARPWFQVYKETIRLPDGRVVNDFYQIEQRDYVEIAAIRSDGKILGLKQYKHGARKNCLGFPAGYVETGESPVETAKRELIEEGGLESTLWSKLGEFVIEGNRSLAKAHVYLAEMCEPAKEKLSSDDLDAPVLVWLTLDEWIDALRKGEVELIGAAMAVMLVKERLR